MGWTCEDGHHEGSFVAVVPVDRPSRFRELEADDGRPVRIVQAACSCGWRSARFRAPEGTTWWPNVVEMPDGDEGHRFEMQAREIWRAHTASHITGQLEDGTRLDALGEVIS